MAFGHPIIRSEASGAEEQLDGGSTGWAVSTEDLSTLVNAIEELLNKDKTSVDSLIKMSKASNKIALNNIENNYSIVSDISKVQ